MFRELIGSVVEFFSTLRHAFDYKQRWTEDSTRLAFLQQEIEHGMYLRTSSSCWQCGASLVEGASYCWDCGEDLLAEGKRVWVDGRLVSEEELEEELDFLGEMQEEKFRQEQMKYRDMDEIW